MCTSVPHTFNWLPSWKWSSSVAAVPAVRSCARQSAYIARSTCVARSAAQRSRAVSALCCDFPYTHKCASLLLTATGESACWPAQRTTQLAADPARVGRPGRHGAHTGSLTFPLCSYYQTHSYQLQPKAYFCGVASRFVAGIGSGAGHGPERGGAPVAAGELASFPWPACSLLHVLTAFMRSLQTKCSHLLRTRLGTAAL